MKIIYAKYLLPVVLIFLIRSLPYQLSSKWLDTSGAYNPYELYYDVWMSDAMAESLAVDPDIVFDLNACLAQMQIDSIQITNGGENSVGSPLLRYSRWVIYENDAMRLWGDTYGVTMPPVNSTPEKRHSFEITLNDSTQFRWDKDGGGYIDDLNVMHGGVDINTIFRHELAHGMGIFHEPWEWAENGTAVSLHNTLMMDGTPAQYDRFKVYGLGAQEINGLEAQYTPPSLTISNSDNNVIFIGDSVMFEIEGPVDTRIDNLLLNEFDADSLFHSYIRYPYDLYPDSADAYHVAPNSGYEVEARIPNLIEWINSDTYIAKSQYTFKPDSVGTYRFKVYTAMNWNESGNLNIYEYYPDRVRPYSEVEFYVYAKEPLFEHFKYKQTDKGNIKESIYTTVHQIGATFVDQNEWVDYPLENMKFYYKYPEETEFTEILSPVTIIDYGYTVYEVEFDTGSHKDNVTIKAEVEYYEGEVLVKSSKEQTFELTDRYLKFVEPKPVGEGFVDFESIITDVYWGEEINFIPKVNLLAEEGFEISRFVNSSIHQILIDPMGQEASSLQYPVGYTLPEDIYNWLKFYSDSTGFTYIYKGEPKANELPATCMALPLSLDSTKTKSLVEYEEDPCYSAEIIRSKPGKYTQKIRCFEYDNWWTSVELTHGEKQDILIPDWKLKTWGGDFRFWPPLQKRDFGRVNDNVEFCIWRPKVSGEEPPTKLKLNTTNINVYKDDTITSVFSTSTVCEPEVTKLIEWVTPGMTPGFYRVEGSEVDLSTGMNVKYDAEIQICPFYEHWENVGFFFDNWSSTIDSEHWGIHQWGTHSDIRTEEVLRDYSLEAKYNTGAEIKYTELQTISIPADYYSEYDLELDFGIGIPATTIDSYGRVTYDQLLANYKVLVSKDGGGSWTVMKLACSDGYEKQPYYGINFESFFYKLGKTGGQTVLIKLVKEGIPEYYTDETEDPQYQNVYFDEIIVKYSKGPLLTAPKNIAASGSSMLFKNTAVNLSWEQAVNADPAYQVQYYNIWRNGKKIAIVYAPTTQYADNDIQPDGRYNYAIEAVYNVPITNSSQAIYKLTSLLDCNIWVNMSDFPPPENLTLTAGTGVEYNNVKLSWEPPTIATENIIGYKIYRNNEYVNTTKKTSYTDYFLEAGEHEYKVSTLYSNPSWESFPSEERSIVIVSNLFLPVLCDFENSGVIPQDWNQQSTSALNWIFVNQHPAGLTFPYETGYFGYFGSETAIPPNTTEAKIYGRLKSPTYNFSSYESVSLIYDYLFKTYRDNSVEFNVYIKDIATNDSLLLSSHTVADMTEWNAVPWIVIPENYLSCDCRIMFEVALNKSADDESVIGSVVLDNIELQGNIGLDPPQNVRITNNQGFVSLAWDPVVNAVAYHIYRSEYPDKNFTEIAIVKPLNYGSRVLPTSYSDIIKKPGNSPNTGTTSVKPAVDNFKKPYYYRVAAEINENLRTPKK